ncbi:MFS transporter, partial [Escherichia coli]|nr:MFS transporter [Escherichia coli]
GIACSMPFAMLGFAVDFGRWKTGIKATGILIAFGSTFFIKMGSGIGTAFAAWIMNSFGYIPNPPQTAAGLDGISWAFIWVPAVLFALAAIPL